MSVDKKTFTESVEAWIEANDDWLTDDDLPDVTALRQMAKALDAEMTATMLSQYGLFLRALKKRKPAVFDEDELESLLTRNGE